MKIFKTMAAIICIAIGGIWALQGAGILPGSLMSGQGEWLAIGAILVVFGLGLLFQTNLTRGTRL